MAPLNVNKNSNLVTHLPFSGLGETGVSASIVSPPIKAHAMLGLPKVKSPFNSLRIGIFAASTSETNDHIVAIANPASSCLVASVAILNPSDTEGSIHEWCKRNRLVKGDDATNSLKIGHGEEGFEDILNDSTIAGVFITGAFDRGNYVEQALKANKHVLADDPITYSIPQFQRLVHLALERRLHLQDTTTFIYHYGLRRFEQCVLEKESFGDITKMCATFDMNPTDARYRGILTPSNSTESLGVIGSLVRYCLLLGNLVYIRAGRKAVSAQITHHDKNASGVPVHAKCLIKFNGGCTMDIDCSYINYRDTRQHIEVHSATSTGTMSDFVFASRGLVCYQLYKKETTKSGETIVNGGDAIDVEVS
jgi:predicted dehydrogenase